MKKKKMKVSSMIVIILLFLLTIGGVSALLVETTNDVSNSFALGSITSSIKETIGDNVIEDVAITNTSEIGAFVRSAIVVNWVSDDGRSVYADKPVLDQDYTLEINDTDWLLGSDGYYYYNDVVSSKADTNNLIEFASLINGVSAPTGYHLSVEVVSSAIQANPKHAVTDAWKVVEWNGSQLVSK